MLKNIIKNEIEHPQQEVEMVDVERGAHIQDTNQDTNEDANQDATTDSTNTNLNTNIDVSSVMIQENEEIE